MYELPFRLDAPGFVTGDAKLTRESPLFPVVSRAYRVFDCPKPDELGVCRNCCMERGIEEDFLRPDIAELPLAYIRNWFFGVARRPLQKSVWSYLLPRILEILAAGEMPSATGIEVSLDRFPTGDRAQWTVEEWEVIDTFRELYLDAAANPASPHFLDNVICMFAAAGFPAETLYAQIAGWSEELLVARLWADWRPEDAASIWVTAFWSNGSRPLDFYLSLQDRFDRLSREAGCPTETAAKAGALSRIITTAREAIG